MAKDLRKERNGGWEDPSSGGRAWRDVDVQVAEEMWIMLLRVRVCGWTWMGMVCSRCGFLSSSVSFLSSPLATCTLHYFSIPLTNQDTR